MPGSKPVFFRRLLQPAELYRAFRSRDQDPFLDELRWRLHLRLLLVSAVLAAGCVGLRWWRAGIVDALVAGVVVPLAAWAFLRTRPRFNRVVLRLILGLFLGLGLYEIMVKPPDTFPWALLALMVMPVFGALLDGMPSGGVAALASLAAGFYVMAAGLAGPSMLLTCAFVLSGTLCFFLTSLAHTWMFGALIRRQRASHQAVAQTTLAAEQLARTLSEEVAKANTRLRAALVHGLQGLDQARALQEILASARAKLPGDVPRGALDAGELLDGMRSAAIGVYLWLAVAVAVVATATILVMGLGLWYLAAGVALVAGLLLGVGPPHSRAWRWRLRVFLVACLASMAADITLSGASPPAASLVFLPLIVFFAGMLDTTWASFSVCLAGLGLLAWAQLGMPRLKGEFSVLVILGLLSAGMLAVSHATLPIYTNLVGSLRVQEESLRASLQSYRRLVSTLFHDLANPLAVLQTLAGLPEALRTQEDQDRANRMLERLETVAGAVRGRPAADDKATVTVGRLAEELYDLFRERLQAKQLRWVLLEGGDLELGLNRPRLRDSVLSNLVSNAVKYSPKAGRVSLQARRTDAHLTLVLRDQGPGFPADVLRDVALGATPASRPGTLGEAGSGFGLLLATSYARELGGELTLRNRADGGAEAELRLPLG